MATLRVSYKVYDVETAASLQQENTVRGQNAASSAPSSKAVVAVSVKHLDVPDPELARVLQGSTIAIQLLPAVQARDGTDALESTLREAGTNGVSTLSRSGAGDARGVRSFNWLSPQGDPPGSHNQYQQKGYVHAEQDVYRAALVFYVFRPATAAKVGGGKLTESVSKVVKDAKPVPLLAFHTRLTGA